MKVLVDSDFLVALARGVDSNHQRSRKLLQKLEKEKAQIFISNLVKFESATVISNRDGMDAARNFVIVIDKFCENHIFVDEKLEKKVWGFFLEQSKKGTSYIDCSNVVLVQKYKLDRIAAFDGFYDDSLKF